MVKNKLLIWLDLAVGAGAKMGNILCEFCIDKQFNVCYYVSANGRMQILLGGSYGKENETLAGFGA